jgi:hypothetical protein
MIRRLCLAALVLLAACSPQKMADDVSRRTARTVVYPIVNQSMPGPEAEAMTTCIVDNATPEDLNLLLRDVGTRAGTSTVQNVKNIALRPATASCIAAKGLGPLMPTG